MQRYTNVLLVPPAKLEQYIQTVQKKVGKLKAGWNAAAHKWKAKVATYV